MSNELVALTGAVRMRPCLPAHLQACHLPASLLAHLPACRVHLCLHACLAGFRFSSGSSLCWLHRVIGLQMQRSKTKFGMVWEGRACSGG